MRTLASVQATYLVPGVLKPKTSVFHMLQKLLPVP